MHLAPRKNVVGWHAVSFVRWFLVAHFLLSETWGAASIVILTFTQFYALMISLPFALSSSRSEIHRGHEMAGAAMLAGLAINAAKQKRDSERHEG